MVVYFDDILVYNRSIEEHIPHLKFVFQVLKENNLFVNLKKYTFMVSKLLFLGFIVGDDGILIDESKVKAIQD